MISRRLLRYHRTEMQRAVLPPLPLLVKGQEEASPLPPRSGTTGPQNETDFFAGTFSLFKFNKSMLIQPYYILLLVDLLAVSLIHA